jgi:hypothetical protein
MKVDFAPPIQYLYRVQNCMSKPIRFIPIFLFTLLALLLGLWAGLIRLGWELPPLAKSIPVYHGALMVSGFVGTLIALERVAALKQRWMFAAPIFSSLGWAAGLLFPGTIAGPALLALASLFTLFILTVIVRREPKIYTGVMWTGSLCWLVGNLLWTAGFPVSTAVPWWGAFLILTISGERLELSRVLRTTRKQYLLFAAAGAIYLSGVLLSLFQAEWGWRIAGLGMLLLSAWLVRFDLARRNLRHPIPLTRYIATCLFTGYIWLGFADILQLALGAQQAGFYYDAMLHSVFLGFVISMIFGHAPIILPALLNVMISYQPAAALNLVFLHLSLVLRIAGDLSLSFALRKWGGLLNEVAVLLFLAVTLYGLQQSRARKGRG